MVTPLGMWIMEGELHSFEIVGTLKWSNKKRNQTHNLLEQIGPKICALRIHNLVADQMSKSGSNESTKQTLRDESCKVPQ